MKKHSIDKKILYPFLIYIKGAESEPLIFHDVILGGKGEHTVVLSLFLAIHLAIFGTFSLIPTEKIGKNSIRIAKLQSFSLSV